MISRMTAFTEMSQAFITDQSRMFWRSRSDLNKYDSAENEIKRRSQPQLKLLVCANLC